MIGAQASRGGLRRPAGCGGQTGERALKDTGKATRRVIRAERTARPEAWGRKSGRWLGSCGRPCGWHRLSGGQRRGGWTGGGLPHTERTWVFLPATKRSPRGVPRMAVQGQVRGRGGSNEAAEESTAPVRAPWPGEKRRLLGVSGRQGHTFSDGSSGAGQESPGGKGRSRPRCVWPRPSTQLFRRVMGGTRLRARGWPGEPGHRPPSCSAGLLAGGSSCPSLPPPAACWAQGRLRAELTLPACVPLACSALVPLREIG